MELVEGAAGAVHLHEHRLEQGGFAGDMGEEIILKNGCQRRACTMTARTRTSLPQRDAGLTGRKILIDIHGRRLLPRR